MPMPGSIQQLGVQNERVRVEEYEAATNRYASKDPYLGEISWLLLKRKARDRSPFSSVLGASKSSPAAIYVLNHSLPAFHEGICSRFSTQCHRCPATTVATIRR